MNIIALIISLISGAIGGNVAGALMKDKSLGTAGNSVAGIAGGGLVGLILPALGLFQHAATGATSSGLDIGSILANIVGGGAGGGILMAIIAAIKGTMKKA